MDINVDAGLDEKQLEWFSTILEELKQEDDFSDEDTINTSDYDDVNVSHFNGCQQAAVLPDTEGESAEGANDIGDKKIKQNSRKGRRSKSASKVYTKSSDDSITDPVHTWSLGQSLSITGKYLSCPICQKLYVSRKSFNVHMHVHDGTQKYECDICSMPFSREADLRRHVLTHTQEKPYLCTVCQKTFRSRGEFERHRSLHKGKNTCAYCGKRLVKDSEFRAHVLKHELQLGITDGMAKFQCKLCGTVLKDEFNLKNHLLRNHKESVNSAGEYDVSINIDNEKSVSTRRSRPCMMCEYCGLEFSNVSNKARHIRRKHSQTVFKCDLCDKTFNCKSNLHEHMSQTHMRQGLYSCTVCAREFPRKHKLAIHMETHNRNGTI